MTTEPCWEAGNLRLQLGHMSSQPLFLVPDHHIPFAMNPLGLLQRKSDWEHDHMIGRQIVRMRGFFNINICNKMPLRSNASEQEELPD